MPRSQKYPASGGWAYAVKVRECRFHFLSSLFLRRCTSNYSGCWQTPLRFLPNHVLVRIKAKFHTAHCSGRNSSFVNETFWIGFCCKCSVSPSASFWELRTKSILKTTLSLYPSFAAATTTIIFSLTLANLSNWQQKNLSACSRTGTFLPTRSINLLSEVLPKSSQLLKCITSPAATDQVLLLVL